MNTKSITLSDIIHDKPVLAVCGTQTVNEALEIMAQNKRRAVGVTVDAIFCGLFTDADFMHRIVMKGRNPKTTLMSEVMTVNPVVAMPDCLIRDAFEVMSLRGYSHLPVVTSQYKLLGVVSQGDLRKDISRKLTEAVKEVSLLRSYAFGSYGASAHY